MASSIRGAADAIAQQASGAPTLSVQNYAIDHVVAGGSATTDGTAGVFLNINGSVLQAPYLDTLTSPVAGQTVRVLSVNDSPTILGRVIGLPAL